MPSPLRHALQIAGVRADILSDVALTYDDGADAYEHFRKLTPKPSSPDLRIHLVKGTPPAMKGGCEVFRCRSWRMLHQEARRRIVRTAGPDQPPLWIADTEAGLNDVTVWVEPSSPGPIRNPVCYPLDQILLVHHLASRQGLLIHSAGIVIDGNAYVLAGRSGAGKSTISRLLSGHREIKLLSDDRIIVRRLNAEDMAWGTPWPGEAGIALNDSAPLGGILLLEQSSRDLISNLAPQEALARLLPTVSVPWYDEATMTGPLDYCGSMVKDTRCAVLEFQKDGHLADLLVDWASG